MAASTSARPTRRSWGSTPWTWPDPSARNGPRQQDVARDVADVAMAAERHRDVHLVAQDLQAARDACLAHRAQSVEEGPPDHGATRAEGHGLEHVLARADAAVHPDLDVLCERLGDRREGPRCA